jgi:chromosomal replication initiator protein
VNILYREINDGLREELLQTLGRHRFRLWFRDATVTAVDERGLTIAVPTDVHRTWLQFTFGDALRQACERVLGEGVALRLEVSPEQESRRLLREGLPQRGEEWDALIAERAPAPSLETFVVRPSGRFPLMLLRQVVAGSHVAGASPIVVCGPAGSGKTHLLAGMAADLERRHPGTALTLSARQFTQRYVTALRAREVEALRAFEVDVESRRLVLLDGLDELATRQATQRELVRLLDRAAIGGPRFVLAGQGHPRQIEGLSPRLRSRLLGGVVLVLQAPDEDALADILDARARGFGVALPPDVREAILTRTSSVRGSVEMLDRWAAASARLARPLEAEWLGEVAPTVAATAREEIVRRAKDLVARHFGIGRDLLERPTKVRSARFPRRVAMYLVYRACALPLAELGAAFGLRSHSSVSRAIREMRALRGRDASVEQLVDGLIARI